MCFDGVKRLCHIRGKLRKKVWINQSDIVLIGLRDYQDAKADVILKYSADEARNLKSYGEFPESVKINETVEFGGEGDDDIEFDDVDSDGSGSDDGDDIDGILNLAQCKLISHPIFLPCFSKSGFCTSTKPCLKNNSNRSPCTSKLNILMCQPKDDQVGQFDCLLDHLILFSHCEI